jgi:hypothetical protein
MMPEKFFPLERYLRDLPLDKQEVTIAFDQIERILGEALPSSAYEDSLWWGNQKQGTFVEALPWMDAGWLVNTVDLNKKLVNFVRQ